MDLNGIVAIVTGGASGLGQSTAELLSQKGATVVVADFADDKGQAVADSIGGHFAHVDVTKTEDIQAAVDLATSLGTLRALVNCAGIGWAQRTVGRGGYDTAHDLDAFKRVLAVNLIGSFDFVRLAGTAIAATEPVDADGQRGAIVNTASIAAFDGQIGQAAYSASKGGLVGMTLPIARDLASVGIRLNTIAPGLIDTPIYGEGEAAEEFKKKLSRDVVFPDRLGKSGEFASLAIELLSNDYMNAQTIRVDGAARLQPK